MADIAGVVGNIGASMSKGLGTTGVYVMYAGIVLVAVIVVGVLLAFYLNKKSYNIGVYIIKGHSGSVDMEMGAIGKHFYDKEKKELRFKIYNGAKKGLMYNNEAIPPKYFVKRFSKGKYNVAVFMSRNSQGWLQPVEMNLVNAQLVAKVENADLSHYQTELELMDALFNKKSFMEKYYLLILVILFIICICILWYMAGQVHKAAQLNQQSAVVMSEAMKYMAERFGNSTATQTLQVG